MERLVGFALEHDIIICHDFAYADLGFDGYHPPSILQVPRAKECCVELYTLTKSFSMAGWRVGFLVGNAEIVAALTKLKSYLDYGTFQPVQIAAIVAMNEAVDYPDQLRVIYQSRRDALVDGLDRIGWHVRAPRGSMFLWASIPEPYAEMSSLEFAKFLIEEADVATSPGVGFGEGGDGHVRFALIENELRTQQAIRNLRKALPKIG
jgi:alanine-synthesizing transaminase